jgi:hypothetical protein
MGRSGSTLLANIINCENRYQVLFEPFSHEHVSQAHDFIYPFFLKPNDNEEKYIAVARDILEGKISSPWIDQVHCQGSPKKRLIKDIRINLFLRWLSVNFSGLSIILLLRHPCAVVHSWLEHGFGDGRASRDRMLATPELFDSFVTREALEQYARTETAFERLIFFWCLFNKIPLRQFAPNEICVIFYENLFLDRVAELAGLFDYLKQTPDIDNVDAALAQPSSTTHKSGSDFISHDNVDGWRDKVSSQQMQRAYEIMEICGLDGLYDYSTSRPNREKLYKLQNIINHT